MLTLKVEFLSNFLQLRDITKMRRQVLDVPSIEPLTGLDEFQVMFFELPFFYRLLLLPTLLTKLLRANEKPLETLPSNQTPSSFPMGTMRLTRASSLRNRLLILRCASQRRASTSMERAAS